MVSGGRGIGGSRSLKEWTTRMIEWMTPMVTTTAEIPFENTATQNGNQKREKEMGRRQKVLCAIVRINGCRSKEKDKELS